MATSRAVCQWSCLPQLHRHHRHPSVNHSLICELQHHLSLSSQQSSRSLLYEQPSKIDKHNELFPDAAYTALSGFLTLPTTCPPRCITTAGSALISTTHCTNSAKRPKLPPQKSSNTSPPVTATSQRSSLRKAILRFSHRRLRAHSPMAGRRTTTVKSASVLCWTSMTLILVKTASSFSQLCTRMHWRRRSRPKLEP